MDGNLQKGNGNTKITGLVISSSFRDDDKEVFLESQTNTPQGEGLDEEVGGLLELAAEQAEKSPDDPIDPETEVVLVDTVLPGGVSSVPANTFAAVAAFVAGLAVVGVVYAFAVQANFDRDKSAVLGDQTESSK